MSSHTPGPWNAVESQPGIYWIDTRKGPQAYGDIATVYEGGKSLEKSAADARLIAAAPDLLAALERIVTADDAGELSSEEIEAGRDAIAKARGGVMGIELRQDTKDAILRWFVTGNVGISSKCIASTMMGIEVKGIDSWTPSDPSDFCRCLKLIRCAPEIRDHLDAMRGVSKAWNTLIDHWEEIEACFMAEVPEWLDGENLSKRATKTYDLMHQRALRK